MTTTQTLTQADIDDGIVAERLTGTYYAVGLTALAIAQHCANINEAPVEIWTRDGWYVLSEIPSDCYAIDPASEGWQSWALVDPQEAQS